MGAAEKGRLLVVAAGAFILIMLAFIVIGLLGSSGGSLKQDYLTLAQEQAELIRVSTDGIQKSRGGDAKNLAVNVNYSVLSQQPAVLALAKKSGVKVDAKTLALAKNANTDKTLAQADQTNQFDEVFTKTMQTLLGQYRQNLQKIYKQTTSNTAKATLTKDYEDIGTPPGPPHHQITPLASLLSN